MINREGPRTRPSRLRLVIFSSGDFAFNLFWQSVMLYQLFYYTEALHIPIAAAAACYAAASVWDGVVSFIIGILADRYGVRRRFRWALILGAAPLGLAFVITYSPPPSWLGSPLAWVFGGQVLFRTAYALVNIPYLAMSARVSLDSGDRALVAGGRMVAGTLAGVLVALGTFPLGRWMFGQDPTRGYAGAAIDFSALGVLMLIAVGMGYREDRIPQSEASGSLERSTILAWRNYAFVTLAAAMTAMIVAVTVMDKSVLYYFKYVLADPSGGALALSWMMAVGGISTPIWLLASRRLGVRTVWFVAIAACLAALAAFGSGQVRAPTAVLVFLVAVRAAVAGLNFALWAMLPDTIEYGQRTTGVRVEAVLYGYTALLQRLAIGLGAALVGASLAPTGLNRPMSGDGFFRLALAGIPFVFFALSGLAMVFNPQRRGGHESIVRELPFAAGAKD